MEWLTLAMAERPNLAATRHVLKFAIYELQFTVAAHRENDLRALSWSA